MKKIAPSVGRISEITPAMPPERVVGLLQLIVAAETRVPEKTVSRVKVRIKTSVSAETRAKSLVL
jgi:hypothetical protein